MADWASQFGEHAFGKFSNSESLCKILDSGRLKWSRPGKFNDPFDCQPRFTLPAYSAHIADRVRKEFKRLVDNEISSISLLNPISRHMCKLAESIKSGTIEFDDAWKHLDLGLQEILMEPIKFLSSYHDQFVMELQTTKILCLTKSFENIVMWSLYADSHKGALLVFCPRSHDSQFTLARPINYTDSAPEILNVEQIAHLFTGQMSPTHPEFISSATHQVTNTKSVSWKYEKEWRITGGDGFEADQEEEFNKFHVDDLVAVAFGARFDQKEIDSIIERSKNTYANIKWFSTRLSKTRLELELEAI